MQLHKRDVIDAATGRPAVTDLDVATVVAAPAQAQQITTGIQGQVFDHDGLRLHETPFTVQDGEGEFGVPYVLRGRARMRWGERLEYVAEAGPGDFIYVPPFVPHQEINASPTEKLECVLVRSDGEAVAINLDIDPVEPPEDVRWIDPTHPS